MVKSFFQVRILPEKIWIPKFALIFIKSGTVEHNCHLF